MPSPEQDDQALRPMMDERPDLRTALDHAVHVEEGLDGKRLVAAPAASVSDTNRRPIVFLRIMAGFSLPIFIMLMIF